MLGARERWVSGGMERGALVERFGGLYRARGGAKGAPRGGESGGQPLKAMGVGGSGYRKGKGKRGRHAQVELRHKELMRWLKLRRRRKVRGPRAAPCARVQGRSCAWMEERDDPDG